MSEDAYTATYREYVATIYEFGEEGLAVTRPGSPTGWAFGMDSEWRASQPVARAPQLEARQRTNIRRQELIGRPPIFWAQFLAR